MRKELAEWVKRQHRGQVIRRTDEPYFNHLLFVAEKSGASCPLCFDIGLCHDLLEETAVTAAKLRKALLRFGYLEASAAHITFCVAELTDLYTKLAFPGLRKKERKKMEDARLANIRPDAQSVKYADLIYNINWMMAYEREGLIKYLRRKQKLLMAMSDGDGMLRSEALSLVDSLLK